MKLLGWDTSSKTGALVALEWDPNSKGGWTDVRLLNEWGLNIDATHSERLLWGIHQVLESVRWKLADVDVFACGVGPGSFTGLRIGVTTARTLAHASNKPLIGVSSLSALARPVALWAADSKVNAVVIAATDACKGELFALYGNAKSALDCVARADGDSPGFWKRGVEEAVVTPEALVAGVRKKLAEKTGKTGWFSLGEGTHRYPDAWKELPAARRISVPTPFPDQVQGRYLGMLAWEAYQAGLARPALEVHPRYLRASDAELKLKAGLLARQPTE